MLISIVPRQKRSSWPLASLKVHGDLQLAPCWGCQKHLC